MSAALVRLNRNRRCATPNTEKPISGWLIAWTSVAILCVAVVCDLPRLVALVIQ